MNNCDDADNINPGIPEVGIEDLTSDNDESLIEICDVDDRQSENNLHGKTRENDDHNLNEKTRENDDDTADDEKKRKRKSIFRRYSLPKFNRKQKSESILPTSETVPNIIEEANSENYRYYYLLLHFIVLS